MSFASLHPSFRPYAEWIYNVALQSGAHPRVTSTKRDPRTQQILYDRYLRTRAGTLRPGEQPQHYPVAAPGTSRHELGAAFDMVLDPGWAPVIGAHWRKYGGFWIPADEVHFGDAG